MLFAVAFLTAVSSFAQMPFGGSNVGKGGKMSIGRLYGKLIDVRDGKPVGAATILLVREDNDLKAGKKKQLVVKGTRSADKGEFSLDEVPVTGTYKLKVTIIGYKPYEQKVSFDISALMKLKRQGDKMELSQGIPQLHLTGHFSNQFFEDMKLIANNFSFA